MTHDEFSEDKRNGIAPTSELVNEKIGDSINYLILLEAAFEAMREARHSVV